MIRNIVHCTVGRLLILDPDLDLDPQVHYTVGRLLIPVRVGAPGCLMTVYTSLWKATCTVPRR